jgi:hypothetical protein
MVFLSAFRDFMVRTLGSLPGPLSRLAYIGELRRHGNYEHWGLSRVHGHPAAETAISIAHAQVWLDVLRTPLPALLQELESLSQAEAADRIARLRAAEGTLTPADTGGGSKRHFNSILLALSLLSRAKKENSRRAA